MFRKTLKQLKVLIIIVIVLVCLPRSILPHRMSVPDKNDLENYLNLNNSETKLLEFKDDTKALKLKLQQLELINNSRKKFKAGPVKLDILASRVANKMCREAAENNYVGHWNLAGEKPYHRYAFAGGYDHISENAFGEWSTDKYDTSYSNISYRMNLGHGTFMAEKAPYNGHKKNIIDKSHNYVGLGFYMSGNQFRYYEEFIDRYLEFENIPGEVKINEPCSITIKTNSENYPYYLIVYREQFPKAMTPGEIKSKGSYEDFTNEQYLKMPAWDLAGYRRGSLYKIPLVFAKEGLYYIQIYSDIKEITKPSALDTRDKTPMSGIVIKVNK